MRSNSREGLPTRFGNTWDEPVAGKFAECDPGHFEATKVSTTTTSDFAAVDYASRAGITGKLSKTDVVFIVFKLLAQFRVFRHGAALAFVAFDPRFLCHRERDLSGNGEFSRTISSIFTVWLLNVTISGTFQTNMRFIPSFLAALALVGSPLLSQEVEGTAEEPKIFRKVPSDPNWLEYYYTAPKPESVEEQIRMLATEGELRNDAIKPAVIAFLSQVIRQNRERIGPWYTSWKETLDAESIQTVQTAMLFSRTSEADSILSEQFGAQYEEQKKTLPKILEMRLDKPSTLDMLWGFYYASGSENAIRRLVMGFRYLEAPDNPENVEVPEDHIPLYKMIPEFAGNSLISNGLRHPKVVKDLQELLDGLDLNDLERREVEKILKIIEEGVTESPQGESSENAAPR